MRGLNGTYIEKEGDIREASVMRCEQMVEMDLMKYNGNEWTWLQFKDYWKRKPTGGWIYDDTVKNDRSEFNQHRFEKAWTIAGPIYCERKNLTYVQFNDSENQRIASNSKAVFGNFHFILALDESASMSGQPWRDLMNSVSTTIDKIEQIANGQDNLRISIIKFAHYPTLYC